MIKYLEQHIGLTNEEKQKLKEKGGQIYEAVQKDGGFIKVFSQRQLPNYLLEDDWANLYKTKMIFWEYKSTAINSSLLYKAYYLTFIDMVSIYTEQTTNWLKHQITVFTFDQLSLKYLNINFNKEWILQYHGQQEIDIRQQQINYDSFQPCKQNLQLKGLTLKDYFDYLDQPEKFIKKYHISENQRLFAVNVSMDGWIRESNHLLTHFPKCMRAQKRHDALSYLRQHMDGVTIPQLYIKTEGVWTGGHQEDLGVTSINVNHGPSNCIWITIDYIDIPNLRNIVKEQFKVDILEHEGLWFKEPDWFLKNNVKFRYTIQQPGDIIILGPGCLHWVKSCGYTINSYWNFAALNEETLDVMSARFKINQELKLKSILPYKNLMLDIYIHEKQLNRKVLDRIQTELQTFFDEENDLIKLIGSRSSLAASCKEVQICTQCQNEIFLYFYHENEEYLCIQCVRTRMNCNQFPILLKYRFNTIYYILQAQPNQCYHEYCSLYTGKTKCQVQEELKQQIKKNSKRISNVSDSNQYKHQQQLQNQLIQEIFKPGPFVCSGVYKPRPRPNYLKESDGIPIQKKKPRLQ